MKKILALVACFVACSPVFAQSNITLDLKDAPIRSTIEMIFKQGGIKNYVIENSVSGFVTMNLTDQPFENALKLVMRANTLPLTYIKENDVWIVRQRIVTAPPQTGGIDPLPETPVNRNSFEKIHLKYIDPFDLQIVFGPILSISQFQRFGMGMSGNSMGNMGFGNGMQGGMGGGMMGGGMMGGMGSFGGGMGGMGGGMQNGMGGMGGFGGGRNF